MNMSASSSSPRSTRNPLVEVAQFLRRSRSLASMLPSLLMTGLVTLLVSGIERLMWVGMGRNYFAAWMETWLTAWPIAFPIVYLLGRTTVRVAARIAANGAARASEDDASFGSGAKRSQGPV
jgi:hypothetical protein